MICPRCKGEKMLPLGEFHVDAPRWERKTVYVRCDDCEGTGEVRPKAMESAHKEMGLDRVVHHK